MVKWKCTQLVRVTMNIEGRVTGLNLARNGLNGYLPVEVGNSNRIEKITIGYEMFVNQYNGQNNLNQQALPQTLENLTKLEILSLDRVYMWSELPDIFGSMTALRELYIFDCYFTNYSLPTSILSCINLEILQIGYNGFYDLPDLSKLSKLIQLRAYGCYFSFGRH